MFGVTRAGASVCMRVHGYSPYLYIAAEDWWDAHALMKALEQSLVSSGTRAQPRVLDVELVMRKSFPA